MTSNMPQARLYSALICCLVLECALATNITVSAPKKKALDDVCDPDANECGVNAICKRTQPCKMGTCVCASNRFKSSLDTPTIDCVPILLEGANCTNVNKNFLPDGSSCKELNGQKIVVCAANLLKSDDGICKTAPPSTISVGLDEPCDGNRKICDAKLGVKCNFGNGTQTGRCGCMPNLVPNADRSLCSSASFGERCKTDDECNSEPQKSFSCMNGTICMCMQNFTLTSTAELSSDEKNFDNKYRCFKGNKSLLKPGSNCTLPVLYDNKQGYITNDLCGNGTACVICPEDKANQGKCRSTSSTKGNDAQFATVNSILFVFALLISIRS